MELPLKADENGVALLKLQCENHILKPLHENYGIDISDAAIRKAVEQHNRVCRIIREIGDFRKEELPEGALENYVREGGTLFISADKLAKGIVSPAFAGVAFGSETVLSAAPLKAKYSLFKPTGTPVAVPLTKDGNGNVIVWSRDVGRGRIVTVACDRMLPDDYAKCAHGDYKARLLEAMSPGFRFEVIRGLLKRVQRETVPVTVEGDAQWGVNRTKEGWLVWLINNNGVTKFFGEPEELDPKATSVVRITYKATGRTYTARVKPGDWTAVRIVNGDFCETVQVK